jgi:hypothetical protein
LQRCRVWGCPVYVLDATLQDGKKIPKWHPRSRRGYFLGFSSAHSSTVGKVLNINIGHISPQYHVVYDELLTTVSTGALREEQSPHATFTLDLWMSIIQTGYNRLDRLDSLSQVPFISEKNDSARVSLHRTVPPLKIRPPLTPLQSPPISPPDSLPTPQPRPVLTPTRLDFDAIIPISPVQPISPILV